MKNERGIALLEFTYTAPILFLFIFAIVDLGRALNFYMHLTRLSYEGARYASALAGLEAGDCTTSLLTVNCPGRPLHALIAERVQPLTSDGPVRAETVQIHSALYSAANPFPNIAITGQDEVVEVEVRAQFEPLIPVFSFLTSMRARTAGPHARVGGS